jgi:biopolymer transport protein ExbB
MNAEEYLFSTGISLIDKGGPVMAILLALSVAALSIILMKLYQFWAIKLNNTNFIENSILHLSKDGPEVALNALENSRHPIAKVLSTTIQSSVNPSMSPTDIDTEVSRVGSREIKELERYLRGLEVIANLSPLLGLLGTVLGMIKAFSKLESAGTKVDPTILAGGIWEALLTTAFGLSVAIPALAAFYLLEGKVENSRSLMKDSATRVITLLAKNQRNKSIN